MAWINTSIPASVHNAAL